MTSPTDRRRSIAGVAALLAAAVLVCDLLIIALGPDGRALAAAAPRTAVPVDLRAPVQVPRLKAAGSRPTPEGATAFVLFWFDALNYSLDHLDTELLAGHTGAGCRQCTGYLIGIQRWKDSGSGLSGGLSVPLDLAIGPFSTTEPVSFAATFFTTPATVTSADGSTADYPGGRTRGGLTVLWTGDRWQLSDLILDVRQAGAAP